MELRSLVLCLAFLLAVFAYESESSHLMRRRETNDDYEMINDDTKDDDDKIVIANITNAGETFKVLRGQNVTLPCEITPKDSGAVISWHKDGTLIFMNKLKLLAPAGHSVVGNNLHIVAVEFNASGTYKCHIQQNPTTPSIYHKLIVYSKPVINAFSASPAKVKEGGTVTLTCDFTSVPTGNIIWSRRIDNDNVNLKVSKADLTFSTNSVVMHNLKPEDSGDYYCYVFNVGGGSSARVKVEVEPVMKVHVHKAIANSAINITAVLKCTVRHEDNPTITWYKDGMNVEYLKHLTHVTTTDKTKSTLAVTPQSDDDFGSFTCEASNHMDKHNKTVQLVQYPVVEEFKLDGLTLKYRIVSHQPIESLDLLLTKIRNNNMTRYPLPITEKEKSEYSGVFDLKDLNAGKYEAVLRVKNTHGFNKLGDSLFIDMDTMRVHLNKNILNADINQTVVVECIVENEESSTITWYKDGANVNSGDIQIAGDARSSNLSITLHDENNFGLYTCVADNSEQKHNQTVELVSQPVIEDLQFEGNKLTWKVHSQQPLADIELQIAELSNAVFSRHFVPIPQKSGDEYIITYELNDFDAGKYEVIIKAKNNYGWGKPTEGLNIELENGPQLIQHASVISGLGNGGHTIRSTSSVLLSTILMYLLVRMF